MLIFCPFDAPLVKPLQQFPAFQKKDNNVLLSALFFFLFASILSSR